MIEMSAANVPALAQPGAILAAAPAPAGSEGAPSADFSAVLAGAALVAQMPESTVAPGPDPQPPTPIVPELVAASAKPAGKSAPSGKEAGKMLPPGKLPVARDTALTTKAQHTVPTDETQDESAPTRDAAPAEQVTVDATVQTARDDQATGDTPVQTAPTAPTPIVIQQTATVLQERTISHDALQTTPETAPVRSAGIVTRQPAPSLSAAAATLEAEQTVVAAPPSPEVEIVADMRPTNTPMAMASDTSAVSSQITPQSASRDGLAAASRGPSAALLRNAVLSNGAPAPSKATAADGTGTAAAVSQSVAIASIPSATSTAPTVAPAQVSTKAALVATAANLILPEVAQPTALAVPADGSRATMPVTDVAPSALARAAADADPASPATLASNPAQSLATTPNAAPAPASMALDGNDIAQQPATLAMAPAPPLVTSMATSILQAASSAIIAPVLRATGETVPTKASDDLTIAAPDLSVPKSDPGMPAIRVEAKVSAPVAQSTRDAVAAASLPAQPSHQALTTPLAAAPTGAPLAAILPVPAPEVAIQQSATIAPAPSQPRSEPAMVAQPALAAVEPAEHKRALPVAAPETPATVTRSEPISIITGNDMRTAAIFAAPTTPATATTPTQDIAALVDRITEARAAAAPNTIRAALVHEDFGSVSLNFRSEASHIHVTLGSADPGFAPAVQAAAAANLANNGSDDAPNRRDASATQTNPQPQDATRNDASSQQQQAQRDRANAGERQPSRQTPGRQPATSGERAATATEPRRRNGIFA